MIESSVEISYGSFYTAYNGIPKNNRRHARHVDKLTQILLLLKSTVMLRDESHNDCRHKSRRSHKECIIV